MAAGREACFDDSLWGVEHGQHQIASTDHVLRFEAIDLQCQEAWVAYSAVCRGETRLMVLGRRS